MEVRDIKLIKLVFEARFPTNMQVFSVFGKLQKHFKDSLPITDYDGTAKMILKDEADLKHLYLSTNNMGVVYEPCFDKDDFVVTSLNLIRYISDSLGIDNFTRFGVRMDLIVPTEDLSKEMEEFFYKLFSKPAVRQLGNSVGDFELTFTAKDNNKYKMSLRFVYRDDDSAASDDRLPTQGLMIDADHFLENITVPESCDFINNSVNEATKKAQNFLGNLLVRSVK